MSNREAAHAISLISHGTMAHLTGESTYAALDAIMRKWINDIMSSAEGKFEYCFSWMDVYQIIK